MAFWEGYFITTYQGQLCRKKALFLVSKSSQNFACNPLLQSSDPGACERKEARIERSAGVRQALANRHGTDAAGSDSGAQ